MPRNAQVTVLLTCAQDPTDPAAYSGGPASLLAALGELCTVNPVDGRLPTRLDDWLGLSIAASRVRPTDRRDVRRALIDRASVAQMSRVMLWARNRAVKRRAMRVADVGGAIQYGVEVGPPSAISRVTYEDSTLRQALRAYAWPHLVDLPHRDRERFIARQRAAYEAAVGCCTWNHWAARSIVADYAQAPAKVHVVGHGVNHRVDPPTRKDWSVPRFLHVGFDWQRKNGDRVVEAFARVREVRPDATLDLVGGHPRIDRPGVTTHGRLSLADPQTGDVLTRLFQRATCFVMPSLHEPTGTVHVEAAVAGVPSIGTTNGGAETPIGDAGRLVDPLDLDAIAAAMLDLADPSTAAVMGERARERSRLFTWDLVAQRLLKVLRPAGLDVTDFADPL